MNLVLSYRRKALLTFLLMSSWRFNEEEEPCFATNDWARMGIPAEDRLVFQSAGFDERSGFRDPPSTKSVFENDDPGRLR